MASARVADVGAEQPAHRGGDGDGAGLLDAPHRHAQVLGLNHHEHAAGRQHRGDGVGDLRGHALLDLEAAGEPVDQPGQLRQAGDPAVLGRDVGHVGPPDERHQVVLAQRGERDVADHDHLVVLGREGDLEVAGRVVVQAREELLVHGGHPLGGGHQTVALGVLPDGLSSSAHRGPDPFDVDAHVVCPL